MASGIPLLATVERALSEACELIEESAVTPPSVLEVVEESAEAISRSRWPEADHGVLRGLIELQSATLGATLAMKRRDPQRRNELRVQLERMRQAAHETRVRKGILEARPPGQIVRWLEDEIRIPREQLSGLLGVDIRTLASWAAPDGSRPDGERERRLRSVSLLAGQLRHALTPEGIVGWFEYRRPELDGRSPRELLGDAHALLRLEELALGVTEQRAT